MVDEGFDALLRLFHPSVDGYATFVDVSTKDEALATILLEPAGKQLGLAYGHTTYDKVVGACVEGVA